MKDLLAALAVELRSQSRSARTIHTYVGIAGVFFDTLAVASGIPSRLEVTTFLARTALSGEPRSPSTRNVELAALRALALVAVRARAWPSDPTTDIAFARKPPRTSTFLDASEVRRLFRATAARAHSPWHRARDLALLTVLVENGLRVSEAVKLDRDAVDLDSATLLGVQRKGGGIEDVPLHGPAVALLAAWLSVRGSPATPALFPSRNGGRLSIRGVQRFCERVGAAMGSVKRVSPHVLRHSFITLEILCGAEITAVSRLAGHASVATTQGYIHLGLAQGRTAIARIAGTVPPDVLPRAGDRQVRDLHAFFGRAENDAEIPLDVEGELDAPEAAA